MSMRGAVGPMDEDEASLEAEVQRELEALGPIEGEDEEDSDENYHLITDSSSSEQDDVTDKVEQNAEIDEYIRRMQKQAARLEEELEECDELIHHSDRVVSTPLPNHEDIVILAKERGIDVETFKKKVLDELDRADVEDERIKMESVHDDEDNVIEPKPATLPVKSIYLVSGSGDTANTFLTGLQEQHTLEEAEYLQLKRHFLGDDQLKSGVLEDGEMTEAEEVEMKQIDMVTDRGEPMLDDDVEPGKLTLNPGEGTIMSLVDPAALERRVVRDILDWEVKWMKKNDQRQQELATIMSEEAKREATNTAERTRRQKLVEEQQKELHLQQQAQEEKLRREAETLQSQIEQSIEQYETEIGLLTESVRMESLVLLQVKEQGERREQETRERAALRIQALFRGYRVYKEKGQELKAHLEEWKEQKTEARIKAIDESRRKKREAKHKEEEKAQRMVEFEKKMKEEEEENRKAKENRSKEETEKLKKIEEEKKRKEEERKIKQEEEEKMEEENKKKEEEEQRRLEEKRKREEIARKEKEAEKKKEEARRKEEEKRKIEEEKRRVEEEKKKADEEKLRLVKLKQEKEAQKRKEEQKKKEDIRAQEEKQRLEAEASPSKKAECEKGRQLGLGTPHSPVPPEGRPKSPRKKINDLRRRSCDSNNTALLLNGVRSPQSSAGSQRSDSSAEPEASQPTARPLHDRPQPAPVIACEQNTVHLGCGDRSLTMPELIEKCRLEWIKSCRPWSKTESEIKAKSRSSVSNRKPLWRPISAKVAEELPEEKILQVAGVSTLQSVTTVELHDLPGYSLKTLGLCPCLRTLRVNQCNAVTTDGLSSCKQLVYLDMQHNALETLNLRDLERLVYVDVSHNCLTVVAGLEGSSYVRYLRAAYNRITCISGLEGLRCLHTLDLSHNQLTTTRGLGTAPTLQQVHLSHNHLRTLDDLHLLGLLQVLKVVGNHITQPPLLANHVLLRELALDDNHLYSTQSLTQSWLPLLRRLSMAQNRLTTIDDLKTCLSLQHLDVSSNQLLDVESLVLGLASCRHLQHLKTEGNPGNEESDFRPRIAKAVPALVTVDGMAVSSKPMTVPQVTDFEGMCTGQLAVWDKLTAQYNQVVSETSDLPGVSALHVRYFTRSHSVAVEQRFAHEYGEVKVTRAQGSADMTFDLAPVSPPDGPLQMKNKFELALQNASVSSCAPRVSAQHMNNRKCVTGTGTGAPRQGLPGNPVQQAAATAIQALWRGHQVRRDTSHVGRLSRAAATIQAAWRGHFTRKILQEMGCSVVRRPGARDHWAATVIQAVWRGHRVRKRIAFALSYARLSFDDDDDLEEDLNFDEVDLSAFDFNEADLEKDWVPPDTPQLPPNHAVLKNPSSTRQVSDAKAAFDAAFNPQARIQLVNRQPQPPHARKQAWRNVDSPLSDGQMGNRPPLPPLSRLSDHSATETQRTVDTARTHRAKKEEQLTEEWGFKDSRTAELMMQRAKKLKYNGMRKNKLSQLDPKQRLALFRKLEETSNIQTVHPSPKKVLPRKEYFQAREEEVAQRATEKQCEQANHNRRTFEWIHTQIGNYTVSADSHNNQGQDASGQLKSDRNLPQMDAHVIAGNRPNLMASPMSIELLSLDGVSTTDNQHRVSTEPVSRLPPIKVKSAPSARVTERMSFRNPKAKASLESIGWGGGKKRSSRR